MPFYPFKCPECERTQEEYRTVQDVDREGVPLAPSCACGASMVRTYGGVSIGSVRGAGGSPPRGPVPTSSPGAISSPKRKVVEPPHTAEGGWS